MSAPDRKPVIIVEGLTARYGDLTILENVSFEVYQGEIFVVLGGSGCGKSTLLKQLIGLNRPAAGRVVINGIDITSATEDVLQQVRMNIGVLFQSGALFGSMTLAQNVSLPLQTYTDLPPGELEDYRSRHEGITYTPLLMKIIASVVRKYPLMNAIRARGFFKDTIVVPDEVDICFAMEKTYKGETFFAIPVIRSVNTKSIDSIASEIAQLSRLPYEELPGNDMVFTFHGLPYCLKNACLRLICRSPRHIQNFFGTMGFSNLGRFGVQIASPTWVNTVTFVIGSVVEKAGVVNDGIARMPFLHVTMSFDHAIFDGPCGPTRRR